MLSLARVQHFSPRAHTFLALTLLTGCQAGYELFDSENLNAINQNTLGGAANASGGASPGGASSTGGVLQVPSGGSGGQDSGMAGAPGSGGDAGTGGAAGVPTSCSTVIADSVLDFSNVQGQSGWTYGYFAPPNFAPDDFIAMTLFGPIENLAEDGWFVSNDYWTAISASKMHPNGLTSTPPKQNGEQHAVRRWTSSESGSLFVEGSLYSYSGSFNGTRGYILVEGQPAFELFAPPGQTEAAPFETVISVGVGERVDVVLDPFEGADQADSTEFVVRICR